MNIFKNEISANYKQNDKIYLYNEIGSTILDKVNSNRIDLIIANACNIEMGRDFYNDLTYPTKNILKANNGNEFNERTKELFKQFFNTLKPNKDLYILTNANEINYLWQFAEDVGFEFSQILVNKEKNIYFTDYNTTFVLKFKKNSSKKFWNSNIMENSNIAPVYELSTTELIKKLIEKSTEKNDIVFTPTLALGEIAIASQELNRYFIGCDNDPNTVELVKKKLIFNKL